MVFNFDEAKNCEYGSLHIQHRGELTQPKNKTCINFFFSDEREKPKHTSQLI